MTAATNATYWHDVYQQSANATDEFLTELLALLPGVEGTGSDAYDQIPRGIKALTAEVERLRGEWDRLNDMRVDESNRAHALEQENALLSKEMDLLRAELPRMCARVREQVLAEAIDSVTTLQAQDADRYANGGGHGSWCSYGDPSHCHGSEAHATHERVLAVLRAARTEVWDDTVPPGGYVCAAPDSTHPSGVCGMPVESEPCSIHNPEETDQ